MDRDDSIDMQIATHAAATGGLVTTAVLRQLGLGDHATRRRVEQGRLFRVFQGVYVVGLPMLDQATLLRASTLYAGPGSGLSEESAAEHRLLLEPRPGRVTVSRATRGERRFVRAGLAMTDGSFGSLRIRQDAGIVDDLEVVRGVRATSVARTLIDLASRSAPKFHRAWRQAEFRRVLDVDHVAALLSTRRRPGQALVQQKLDDHLVVDLGPLGVETLDELDAVKYAVAQGAPPPLVQHWIVAGGRQRRLDLYWELARLCVEIDEWSGHGLRTSFEDDRRRDADLLAMGIATLRFTAQRLRTHPRDCGARILQQIQMRTAMRTA